MKNSSIKLRRLKVSGFNAYINETSKETRFMSEVDRESYLTFSQLCTNSAKRKHSMLHHLLSYWPSLPKQTPMIFDPLYGPTVTTFMFPSGTRISSISPATIVDSTTLASRVLPQQHLVTNMAFHHCFHNSNLYGLSTIFYIPHNHHH